MKFLDMGNEYIEKLRGMSDEELSWELSEELGVKWRGLCERALEGWDELQRWDDDCILEREYHPIEGVMNEIRESLK